MKHIYYKINKAGEVVPCDNDDPFSDRDFKDSLVRQVGIDVIGRVIVSSIFLSVDHNFFDDGEPILFETMVFNGVYNGMQKRYSTWEAAEKGHEEILKQVSASSHWFNVLSFKLLRKGEKLWQGLTRKLKVLTRL